MNLTSLLAFWGTVVSTIALTWNIIRGSQDKRRLKVEVQIGIHIPGDTSKKYIDIIMTNIGRRPIYVTGWGAMKRKKKKDKGKPGLFVQPRGLPKMLKEGDYHIEFTDDFSFFSHELKFVYSWDSTGKRWKISKKNLKSLLKEGREVLQKKLINNCHK